MKGLAITFCVVFMLAIVNQSMQEDMELSRRAARLTSSAASSTPDYSLTQSRNITNNVFWAMVGFGVGWIHQVISRRP